jgi:hypothetical protein
LFVILYKMQQRPAMSSRREIPYLLLWRHEQQADISMLWKNFNRKFFGPSRRTSD